MAPCIGCALFRRPLPGGPSGGPWEGPFEPHSGAKSLAMAPCIGCALLRRGSHRGSQPWEGPGRALPGLGLGYAQPRGCYGIAHQTLELLLGLLNEGYGIAHQTLELLQGLLQQQLQCYRGCAQPLQGCGEHWAPGPVLPNPCLLYTSPSPRDLSTSRMPSSA